MKTIGVTGSIAMGKSTVTQILAEQGLPIFDADKEVHALYDSLAGAELLRPLVPQATKEDRVDRKALSDIVFQHPEKLDAVEKVVHAEIADRRVQFTAKMQRAGHDLVVFDIPLLFEKNHEGSVDFTIVVSSPENLQRRRALDRVGMSPERFDAILKRQMPDSEKRKRAQFVIENDGTQAQLHDRVLAVLADIRKHVDHARNHS